MKHSFDVGIAQDYGINSAILFDNIYNWVIHNAANEKHFHDGYYWTYNSITAFMELFPYMSRDKIKNAIKKLVDAGLIVEGNYNVDARDRTKWYAVTEFGFDAIEKSTMHFAKFTNGMTENAKCNDISNIYIDNQTTINTTIRESKDSLCQTGENPVRQVERAWNSLAEYGVPKINKMSTTSTRCKMLNARISEYGLNEVLRTVDMIKDCDFLLGRSSSGWLISFDWFVKPNNFPKVNEGKYLNRTPMSSAPAVQTMCDEYEGYQ